MSDTKKRIKFLDMLWGCYHDRFNPTDKDNAMLTEIKEIVEGEPILRRLLWIRHGCSHPALYGDDGQMDCNSCIIDFKDTLAKDIESRFQHIGELKLKQQQSRPKETPGDDLVEEIMQTIKKCFASVPHAWQDVSRETLVKELRKLLQPRQPVGNTKELYAQWAKEMLEIHGEMTPHYWAAGESILYWLQSRQPEKATVTKEWIRGLVGMGWGVQVNAHKEVDPDLVFGISEMVADGLKSKGIEVTEK